MDAELAGCPAGLPPGIHELAVLREPHDPVVAGFAVTVGDEDVAGRRHDDVARRGEVVRAASLDTGRSERQQHLAGRTELDDDVPALVALRNAVGRHRVGHPDVAFAIDVEPVRPDEQAAAEGLRDLPVGSELHDRIGLRIAALVAEARRVLEAFAADDGPDVLTVRVDDHLAHGAHGPAVGQLRPAFGDAIWIREPLRLNGLRTPATRRKGHRQAHPPHVHSCSTPRFERAGLYAAVGLEGGRCGRDGWTEGGRRDERIAAAGVRQRGLSATSRMLLVSSSSWAAAVARQEAA